MVHRILYFGPPDEQWLRTCPNGGTGRRVEDIEAVIWGGAGAGKKHNSIRGARAAKPNVSLCVAPRRTIINYKLLTFVTYS